MAVRMTVVAGQFYESSEQTCRRQIEQMMPSGPIDCELPKKIIAGIVPHAGWMFSGDLALRVLAAIRQQQVVDTFVIFGAVHAVRTHKGLLYDQGQWGTPLGTVDVDEEIAGTIREQKSDLIQPDCRGHNREHSIEVQVPLIRFLFPQAAIVPIMVPPVSTADEIGRIVARAVADRNRKIVFLASTDLTHYGDSYGFTPLGTGTEALRWAKEENDKLFIDLSLSMQAEQIVESAQLYGSACGAGAVAAALAGAKEWGAQKGYLLGHTTSAEVIMEKFHQTSDSSVGYVGAVFG